MAQTADERSGFAELNGTRLYYMEQPAAFSRPVLDFLARVDARQPRRLSRAGERRPARIDNLPRPV